MLRIWNRIWTWTTAKASRTWVAHGLVTLSGSTAFSMPWFIWTTDYPAIYAFACAATGFLILFSLRECGDKIKYMGLGTWNTSDPAWRDGVPPSADAAGDLVGPLFVTLTAWAAVLLA